jgi:magnesium chelatase subunit I
MTAFLETWAIKDAEIRDDIIKARSVLPKIKTDDAILADCAALCIALGSDGLRGELTLLRTARAWAAYQGRNKVIREDLQAVAPMALRHRLRRDPLDEAGSGARVARIVNQVFNTPSVASA